MKKFKEMNKKKKVSIIVAAVLLVAVVATGIVLGVKNKGGLSSTGEDSGINILINNEKVSFPMTVADIKKLGATTTNEDEKLKNGEVDFIEFYYGESEFENRFTVGVRGVESNRIDEAAAFYISSSDDIIKINKEITIDSTVAEIKEAIPDIAVEYQQNEDNEIKGLVIMKYVSETYTITLNVYDNNVSEISISYSEPIVEKTVSETEPETDNV